MWKNLSFLLHAYLLAWEEHRRHCFISIFIFCRIPETSSPYTSLWTSKLVLFCWILQTNIWYYYLLRLCRMEEIISVKVNVSQYIPNPHQVIYIPCTMHFIYKLQRININALKWCQCRHYIINLKRPMFLLANPHLPRDLRRRPMGDFLI